MKCQFYREHKYVSATLNDLERLIGQADFCDAISLAEVTSSFSDRAEMLKGHAEYENKRLHFLLKQKNSQVLSHTHVEEDHAAQDEQLLKIERSLKEIFQNIDPEKKN